MVCPGTSILAGYAFYIFISSATQPVAEKLFGGKLGMRGRERVPGYIPIASSKAFDFNGGVAPDYPV